MRRKILKYFRNLPPWKIKRIPLWFLRFVYKIFKDDPFEVIV